MSVGFQVDEYSYEIGSASFLNAFFSTVAYRLENKKWGSRFPAIMRELYPGDLGNDRLRQARLELEIIHRELRSLRPCEVIWDIEDLTKRPPWGDDIDEHITNLADLFVTSDGEDFFDVFREALDKATELDQNLYIT